MSRFSGKVAIVTGAGSGIGEACAVKLAGEGAQVVATDLRLDAVQAVVDAIKANGGQAVALQQDVAQAADSERVVNAAVETFGGLHLAVNNAGIGGEGGPTGEVSIEGWLQVININLNGVFFGCRYQIPAMLACGGGAIVNMGSIHSVVGTPLGGNSAYVAAKHGVQGLSKNIAAEYGAKGIRCNTVGPGYIDTPLLSALPDEATAFLVTKHPIGRLGHAPEVANAVAFLLSDEASNVTGAYLTVDGGFTSV
jgi:NAD(P)-dependent dehydrogenase (short-subunit alcohol dehydrogenase family)